MNVRGFLAQAIKTFASVPESKVAMPSRRTGNNTRGSWRRNSWDSDILGRTRIAV
jgi:hypothetical protein